MTKEEIDQYTAPDAETFNLVQQWLESHGLTKARHDSNWVNIRVPISVAEHMLQAEYGIYTDGESSILRTQAYSLPSRLHEHVDLVAPTIYFGNTKRAANTIANDGGPALGYGEPIPGDFPYETKGEIAYGGLCNSTNVTLACLARHYGYENYSKLRVYADRTSAQSFVAAAKAADKNSFGITG